MQNFHFFQYFWKEAFKFCGALLLHYVFWVKRKEKNRLKWILLPWLTGFHCPKLGILNLLEEKEDGIFIDPNYIKSMFFYKHFHTIISILFLKITILYFKKWEKYDGNIVVLLIFQKLGMKYAFIKIAHPRDCRIHYLYFYEKSYKSRFIV